MNITMPHFKKSPVPRSYRPWSGVQKSLGSMLWFVGRHAFFVILVFLALDLVLSAWIFYQGIDTINQTASQVVAAPVIFSDPGYQAAVNQANQRQASFQQATVHLYQDPFR